LIIGAGPASSAAAKVLAEAGVDVLLIDQQPRLYIPNGQANTDPSTFDVLGRRYFVGLNARF
jgi:iron complex outermembrane receptor protein